MKRRDISDTIIPLRILEDKSEPLNRHSIRKAM